MMDDLVTEKCAYKGTNLKRPTPYSNYTVAPAAVTTNIIM